LKLVVVSNSNGTVRKALARAGLSEEIDIVVDSHEERVAKPDPTLFRIALERAHARPETTVHVGDMYRVDVLGARAAGLRAILFDASGMYASYDCPKVRHLQELADRIEANDV
jgi:putative hydrolase of the HAD superfamily